LGTIAAGAGATFFTDNQAGSAALIVLGAALVFIAIVRRIPLRLEVGGTKLDATYVGTDEAYDVGREAGVAQGLETAVDDVKELIEKGEASDRVLEPLVDQMERLGLTSQSDHTMWLDDQGTILNPRFRKTVPEDVGYRGPTACAAAGITFRQLDYWNRTALVPPSLRPEPDSDGPALYSFRDILILKIVKQLLDTGVSLQQIRLAVSHLYPRRVDDLASLTIMSDGVSVYECSSPDEVVALVERVKAFFGISMGRTISKLRAILREMPGEQLPAL
jgi:DNA-binding transcriptional MerR regulator